MLFEERLGWLILTTSVQYFPLLLVIEIILKTARSNSTATKR